MLDERIKVFISYKREDQAQAEELWQTLTDWGYQPWLDVKDIKSGISRDSSSWVRSIDDGLRQCQALIGLITPQSLASENVTNEWLWAENAKRRILLMRLRPFEAEAMTHKFAATDYIDLHADKARGMERLHHELEQFKRERQDFKQAMTPPPAPPLEVPDYLDDKPQKKYTPWRLTLRFLSAIVLLVAFLWLMVDPGFEALLAFLGALGSLIASFVGEESDEGDIRDRSKLTDYQQMRKRVYRNWVQGVMQTALAEVEAVGIGLSMQPEAVVRDNRRDVGDIPLANDSRHVRQVYDALKSFLILGDPGAGKTIMLLQLAESLICQPPPTHRNAIPLVLNLSSWALNPKPLAEWLETETWRTYRVRGGRVRDWLKNNQLILLLDGLDEVKEERRADCVAAINTFRETHDFVPMVVCSRIKDYERLGDSQLQMPGAILLEALSAEQVDRYLSAPGLAHLKRVVADDPILREMATTPFLLNTMIYAYRHEREGALTGFTTEAARREHLFNTYVQRRLSDNPSPYGYQQTVKYLSWLATKMQAYVQTVFRPEDITPDWLADDVLYGVLPTIINGLRVVYAVIVTVLFALGGWQMGGWLGVLGWGALGAAIGGGVAYAQRFRLWGWAELRDELKKIWQYEEIRNILAYILLASLVGLILIPPLSGYIALWLAVILIGAVLGGLFFLIFSRGNVDTKQEFMLAGLLFAGIGSLIMSLLWPIADTLSVLIWLSAPIASTFLGFLLLHLAVFEAEPDADMPNAKRTIINSARAVLLSGLIFGFIGWWLNIGLLLGIAAALTYFGLFNGLTLLRSRAIYKPLLWLRIRQRDNMPSRLRHFLKAMTGRQIMREMGGGHIFIHRYLLENFAGVDEIRILIDQLDTYNDITRQKAIMALENVGLPALRPLDEALRDAISPEYRNRIAIARDTIQMRRGVGVIIRDGVKLPDIDWVKIPAGEFIYGDDNKDDYPEWAKPADRQILTLPDFYIARYPVTYAQFQTFIDDPEGYRNAERWFEGLAANDNHKQMLDQSFKYANHPRETVNWYQAVAFCRWLSWRLGGGYALDAIDQWAVRLPTEFEWEKAARGNTGWWYPYGDEFDATKGNTRETGIGQTSAVGIFPDGDTPHWERPLSDLSGNVWDWCLTDYSHPQADATKENLSSSAARVVRGGSFYVNYHDARAAYRYDNRPASHYSSSGLRCVCVPSSLLISSEL